MQIIYILNIFLNIVLQEQHLMKAHNTLLRTSEAAEKVAEQIREIFKNSKAE